MPVVVPSLQLGDPGVSPRILGSPVKRKPEIENGPLEKEIV